MTDKTVQFVADKVFAEQVMAGDTGALREFYRRYEELFSKRLVYRAGDFHVQFAIDAVAEFLCECVAPSLNRRGKARAPRLSRYDGSAPLEATLYRWCLCKFLDKLRHQHGKLSLDDPDLKLHSVNAEDILAELPDGQSPDGEQAIITLVHNSVSSALENADQEGIVLMRLAFLHNVPQKTLADAWSVHPTQIGRRIKATLESIQQATIARIHRQDPTLEITWEDILCLGEHTCALLWDDVVM